MCPWKQTLKWRLAGAFRNNTLRGSRVGREGDIDPVQLHPGPQTSTGNSGAKMALQGCPALRQGGQAFPFFCHPVTGFRPSPGTGNFWMRKFLERDLFESHQLPTLKAGAISSSALNGGFGLQVPASTTPFVSSANHLVW